MSQGSAECEKCRKWSSVPDEFRPVHSLLCPECGNKCYLHHSPIEQVKKELSLPKGQLTGEECKLGEL